MKRLLLVVALFGLFVPMALAAMPDNQEQQQNIKKGFDASIVDWKIRGESSSKIIEFGQYARKNYLYYVEKEKDNYFLLGYSAGVLNTMRTHAKRSDTNKQNLLAIFFYDKTQFYCEQTDIKTDELAGFLGIDLKILQNRPEL